MFLYSADIHLHRRGNVDICCMLCIESSCSLCGGGKHQVQTFRHEAGQFCGISAAVVNLFRPTSFAGRV